MSRGVAKWLGSNLYYFGGMAAAFGLWNDHAHVWLWIAAAFILCFIGASVLDRR